MLAFLYVKLPHIYQLNFLFCFSISYSVSLIYLSLCQYHTVLFYLLSVSGICKNMACSVKSKFLIRCTEPFLGQPLLLLQAHSSCTDLLHSVHHPDLLSLFSVCLPSPTPRIHFPEAHVSFPSVFPIPVFGTE